MSSHPDRSPSGTCRSLSASGPGRWVWTLLCAASTLACQGDPEAELEPGPTQAPSQTLQFGGPGFQEATSIASREDGVVIGGVYADGLEYQELTLPGGGALDGYVLGLASDGALRFAHRLAGAGDDGVIDVTSDEQGSTYVAGHVSEGAELDGTSLEAGPEGAALLAKLDRDGALEWAVTGGGSGVQSVTAVAVAPDGAVYCAGDFTAELDFGAGASVASGGGDAFLARFSASGELEWLRAIGGSGVQLAQRLVLAPDGSALVGGAFVEQLSIDDNQGIVNDGLSQTPFVASFDSAGTLFWLQSEVIPPDDEDDDAHAHDASSAAGHTRMHTYVEKISIAGTPAGGVLALVAYGEFFSLHGQDFEAPAVSKLAVKRMNEVGGVVARAEFENPMSLIQIGNVVPVGEQMFLLGSWTGELELDDRGFVSNGRRSLLLSRIGDDGALREPRRFDIESTGLTAHDAVSVGESLWVAARSMDPLTNEQDVFIARFEP